MSEILLSFLSLRVKMCLHKALCMQ